MFFRKRFRKGTSNPRVVYIYKDDPMFLNIMKLARSIKGVKISKIPFSKKYKIIYPKIENKKPLVFFSDY